MGLAKRHGCAWYLLEASARDALFGKEASHKP